MRMTTLRDMGGKEVAIQKAAMAASGLLQHPRHFVLERVRNSNDR